LVTDGYTGTEERRASPWERSCATTRAWTRRAPGAPCIRGDPEDEHELRVNQRTTAGRDSVRHRLPSRQRWRDHTDTPPDRHFAASTAGTTTPPCGFAPGQVPTTCFRWKCWLWQKRRGHGARALSLPRSSTGLGASTRAG